MIFILFNLIWLQIDWYHNNVHECRYSNKVDKAETALGLRLWSFWHFWPWEDDDIYIIKWMWYVVLKLI